MEFLNIQKGKLNLTFNNKDFYISVTAENREHSLHFKADSIKKHEEAYVIHWTNNAFGTLDLFLYMSKDNTPSSKFSVSVNAIKDFYGVINLKVGFISQETPYFMIPGNFYGTNNAKNSKGRQPQLNYRGDLNYPKTPTYYTRVDRSSHRSILSICDGCTVALTIDELTRSNSTIVVNGLGLDTTTNEKMDSISVTIGHKHFPVYYRGKVYEKSHTKEQVYAQVAFKKNSSITIGGWLLFDYSSNLLSYENILRKIYGNIHTPPANRILRDEAVLDLAHALVNDTYNKQYHYFPTVLSGNAPDTGVSGDVAWTGGMQVAYPLIRASEAYPEAFDIAVDFIESLVENGVNPQSGMFYEAKEKSQWKVMGWWKNCVDVVNRHGERLREVHSAYVNGQATCYLLKSYQYLRDRKQAINTHWYTAAKSIIDAVISEQRFDGALGVYFDPANGKPVYFDSFQGAWFLAGIAELAKITGEPKYNDAFYHANSFYSVFIEKVEVWGTPIDTKDAVDQEGNLAYITALKTMHEVTGDDALFKQLEHACHYDFTWKFAYNTHHFNEPLKSLNWPSCGGCITSTHNIHIHQMGNLIAEEIYYVYKINRDPYFLSRLKDTLNWGLGTHNNGDERWGYGKRGWATEQFYHTDGIQDFPDRVGEGGIWADYLSWAAACVLLSSVAGIEDEYYT